MCAVDENGTRIRITGRNRIPNRNRFAALIGLAAVPVLLAGCGAGSGDVSVSPGTPAATPGTQLSIVVDDGAGKTQTSTLTCDPAGGTQPNPAAACTTLAAEGKTALAPVPKGVMCTQIFGGAQTAKITGTWNGNPVNASLNRKNGCEISRWKALTGILPATPGVGAGALPR
jgi:hypothetical protein